MCVCFSEAVKWHKYPQFPTLSRSRVTPAADRLLGGKYHCYSFGTNEDRSGIHCIDSTSQLSPYVKTVIFSYFPHETPKERPKTKHKQLCEMALHLTATLTLQGGRGLGGGRWSHGCTRWCDSPPRGPTLHALLRLSHALDQS